MGNIIIKTVIPVVATIISITTVAVSIYNNSKTNKQYLSSLDPLLSLKLIDYNSALYLQIINTGKTAAFKISVNVIDIKNNGHNNKLELDSLFGSAFDLYPNEFTQGQIAYLDNSINGKAFPKIVVDIHYNKSDKKEMHYERTVVFSPAYENKIYGEFKVDLSEINRKLDVIARANLRMANYLDGCQVSLIDELDVLAQRSLHDDLKSVVDGDDGSTIKCRTEVIDNSI